MLRSIGKQSGKLSNGVSYKEKKESIRWEGFAENEGFKYTLHTRSSQYSAAFQDRSNTDSALLTIVRV